MISKHQLGLGREVPPGSVIDGWYYFPSAREIVRARKARGVAYICKDRPIRMYHAESIEDVLKVIEQFRGLAQAIGSTCFYRGQNRDYFEGRYLTVSPSAFRPGQQSPFSRSTNRKEIATQLAPWLEFMQGYSIDLGTCLNYHSIDDAAGFDYGFLRFTEARFEREQRSSTSVLGILQHYGFPTYCIDVSADVSVSMWFALHRFDPMPSGALRCAALQARCRPPHRAAREVADWPTLHIYMQSSNSPKLPVIDLTADDRLGRNAARPKAQRAYVLPFKSLDSTLGPRGVIVHYETDLIRRPSAIVKLYFGADELRENYPQMTKEAVLPLGDPLYRQMLAAKLPRLHVYEG